MVGSEKPYFPPELMIRISLLVPPFLMVRVYSPGVRVESRTRKVPSGVSRSLFDTSSLLGERGK